MPDQRTSDENEQALLRAGIHAGAATQGWNARYLQGLVAEGLMLTWEQPGPQTWHVLAHEPYPGDPSATWDMPTWVVEWWPHRGSELKITSSLRPRAGFRLDALPLVGPSGGSSG